MLDTLRGWILALTATALICGVCKTLAPEGPGKRVVGVVCGFAMLAALLGLPGAGLSGGVESYVQGFTEIAQENARRAQEAGLAQTRFIIEEQSEAYILDKAAQLGENVTEVSVTARWSEEGFWVPVSCSLRGDAASALPEIIETELGIPRERQTWSTKDGD